MKFSTQEEEDPKQNKLLETYMKIVKTGAPEEIEEFSKIERQKLVELLCTNQDLLNFMFDKMFMNIKQSPEQENEEPPMMTTQNLFAASSPAMMERQSPTSA